METIEEKRATTARSLAAQAPVGQELIEHEPTETASLMGAIISAASNEAVNIDKLERLMAMHKDLRADSARVAYLAALSEMQDELPIIKERGSIKIGGNNSPGQGYALWEDINREIKPVLKKHGFALSFRTGQEDGKIVVTGILSHRAGHSEETTMHLPLDSSGSKNAVQAVGSSTSYGKRYTAGALLNFTSTGEDDDGNAAGGNGAISEEQLATLDELIERSGADVEAFVKYMGVEAKKDIRAKDYEKAITALNTKLHRSAKKAEGK